MTSDPNTYADVTVVIPAYRAATTIGRALMSIAGQTQKPKAIVVVDDGSPDETFSVTEQYADRLNGIELVVLRQQNAGPGAARNKALAMAKTEYVAFLDADDEWLPEKIARSMVHMKAGRYVLVAHDSLEVDGAAIKRLDCAHRFRNAADAPFDGLYRRGFIDTTTVIARLDAVRAVGGFDVTLPNAQDFDLWLALLADPEASYLVFDEVLSRYHRTFGSVMTHIERRRQCCMRIAHRYAGILHKHPGGSFASLWFRTLAVHREAFAAHAGAGDWAAAGLTLFLVPGNLALISLSGLLRRPPMRDNVRAARLARLRRSAMSFFPYLWVVGGIAAWMYQFSDTIPSIVRLLNR